MTAPRHIFRTHIRAAVDDVWRALTDPEMTRKYFHGTAFTSNLTVGSGHRYVMEDGTDAVVGEVEEVDPPHRLVVTWRVLYDAAAADEPPGRVEWELTDAGNGITRLTTIHRDLGRSPVTSAGVGVGWPWVLDSLKSLLETGEPLAPVAEPDERPEEGDGAAHRFAGIEANNSTWELLGEAERSDDEAADLLERAYAAGYHWRRASGRGPENDSRAAWLLSRTHAVLGHGELALWHADRCAAIVAESGLIDFDLAYAHEARARALACLGRFDDAAAELQAARDVDIVDAEDRQIVESDLAAGPWYGLTATLTA